jgi:hypothetical protein
MKSQQQRYVATSKGMLECERRKPINRGIFLPEATNGVVLDSGVKSLEKKRSKRSQWCFEFYYYF